LWEYLGDRIDAFIQQDPTRQVPPSRILDYLEDSLAFMPKIDGFSKRRLRLLLHKYEKNTNDFLDIRAEIEIIRHLDSYGVSPINWESQDDKPHPDVVFNFNGSPVNIEVTRLRRAREEEQLEEQCRVIERRVDQANSPFGVLLFLDTTCLGKRQDLERVTEEVIKYVRKEIDTLLKDKARMTHLSTTHSNFLRRKEKEIAKVLQEDRSLPPEKHLKGFLDVLLESSPAEVEVSLDPVREGLGTATLELRNTPGTVCECVVQGQLPDQSEKMWDKLITKCHQLPQQQLGIVLLWVDRNACLVDLLGLGGSIVLQAGKHKTVQWHSVLENLFKFERKRLSGVIFFSGFEKALIVNPVAVCPIESDLGHMLQQALKLDRVWGTESTDSQCVVSKMPGNSRDTYYNSTVCAVQEHIKATSRSSRKEMRASSQTTERSFVPPRNLRILGVIPA